MLTDEQLAILKQINSSIAFDGDDRGEADKLVIEGYVLKDGDLYQLTAIGEKALLDNRARVDELNCEAGDNIAWQKSKAAPVANRTAPARRADRINEVRYEAKKSGKSKAAGKKAVNKVGSSRKRVEASLTR